MTGKCGVCGRSVRSYLSGDGKERAVAHDDVRPKEVPVVFIESGTRSTRTMLDRKDKRRCAGSEQVVPL